MIKEIYPALFYYLSCYLNQDFDIVFGYSESTLLTYKKMETSGEKKNIKNEANFTFITQYDIYHISLGA